MQAPIPDDAQHSAPGGPTVYLEVESSLRQAGRLLEHAGVADPEAARLAGVCFRLAQRIGINSGRLEQAA